MKQHSLLIRLIISALVLIMVAGAPGFARSQAIGTQVLVDPASSTATTCATHTIAIKVVDVTDLTGYHLEISFDPAVVEVTDVVNGGFLDGAIETAFYEPSNEVDNVNGFISFGMAQQRPTVGEVSPKSGSGDLILITMQALVASGSSDFIIDASESMLVDWPDAFEISFTATNGSVDMASCPPTEIDISKALVPENEPVGTEVGGFATTDPDPGDTFTYTLVDDGSFPDNQYFYIVGDQLFTNAVFDYEVKSLYTIRVRSTDQGGSWTERTFFVQIEDVNDLPVAYDQDLYTLKFKPVDFTLTGYDQDNVSLDFVILTPPSFGTLSGVSPNLTYTPDPSFSGQDSFTFRAFDGLDWSNTATITINTDSKAENEYHFPIFFHANN